MQPTSILQIVASVAAVHPSFMNAAALATDPVERMKWTIAASISWVPPTHSFDKPLNPVLGETFQAVLDDGTEVFMEQSFHKPPISHAYIIGPDEIYKFSGYSHYSVKAHLNSLDLIVEGGKTIWFKDGSIIKYNNMSDIFGHTFFGTLNH
mmetsp:Transcript_23209/g.17639  ORF Transcript_23209/g.17639 Transcript_23209/m.17639 type:complete len:151 (-) Transcript_23209:443-895(-)